MAAASKRTATAKSVKFSLLAKTSTGLNVLQGTGAYNFTTHQGRFEVRAVTGNSSSMQITDDALYVKVTKQKPEDPEWYKLTNKTFADAAASGNNATVASAQFLDGLRDQIDPTETLVALGADVTGLKKVKSEKLRGVQTTRLHGRIDLSDAAIAKAAPEKRASLQAAQKSFGKNGYPVDVWFDAEGRVRRVSYVLENGDASDKTSTTVTLDLFDFGKPDGIAIPADNAVGDGAKLLTPPTAAK